MNNWHIDKQTCEVLSPLFGFQGYHQFTICELIDFIKKLQQKSHPDITKIKKWYPFNYCKIRDRYYRYVKSHYKKYWIRVHIDGALFLGKFKLPIKNRRLLKWYLQTKQRKNFINKTIFKPERKSDVSLPPSPLCEFFTEVRNNHYIINKPLIWPIKIGDKPLNDCAPEDLMILGEVSCPL